ncbi:hypothetical protein [Anaeromyxobacter paludicola]|uniref:Outer membrane protein beta-barrel domain-containing protein n=1 Tax=Anaeromyxobacter paludicola TaxID=2918171 RepID=A0ABN6N2E3_9BACT|nr:hypothetical protein [Anaeromyxobacter paludicola]BDG07361.1 hypothetical protein AMPC_04740 [Anaeromyxobacter paludicola]
MRLAPRAVLAAAALSLSAVPAAARASVTLEASVGKGWKVSPGSEVTPTNLMLTPGLGILGDVVQAQLGLVANLSDVQRSSYQAPSFDLELRPMLKIAPPLVPVYGKAILAVTNLTGSAGPTRVAYGAAAGVELKLPVVGLFLEAGALPRSVDGTFVWVVEGRAGASLSF